MPADPTISPLALRWMMVGEWRAHPGRVAVAALAIAIGVALGFAVHLVNRSALDEFARAVGAVNGDADLQVHATSPAGFDEALYPRLARMAGVQSASPVVELTAKTGPGPDASLTLLGLDPLRAAGVTPSLLGHRNGPPALDADQTTFDPQALYLSPAALQAGGWPIGRQIVLSSAGRTAMFVLAGTLPAAGEDQRIGVIDIAAAQWRFGQIGRLQRIDLRLVAGADPDRVQAQIRRLLPPEAEIVTRQSQARSTDSLSRAYRVNLEMLAMVALLTGGFLVYSAQSLSVARRRPQFALLRVLGLTRTGLLAQIWLEGALVGLIGAVGGIALGVGLAETALRLLGGDLGGGYFSGPRPALVFAPWAAAVFLGLGLATAFCGSLLPALDALRVQPAVALKAGVDEIDPRRTPSPWIAVILLAAGGLTALGPPLLGLPLFGYLAMALMLAGGIAAMPWLARIMLAPLRRIGSPSPALGLALDRLWGAPGQAAIALCGIVASTSLMIAMAVMVTSFRGSVDDWLTRILPSDIYMRIEGASTGGFDPALQQQLTTTPGAAAVSFRKTLSLRLSPDRPPVALIVRPIDRTDPRNSLPIVGLARPAPQGATPVWLSEPMARLYAKRPGERMALPLGPGITPEVYVAGVWRDYARQFGAIAMDEADYNRLTQDRLRTEAAVDLAPGARAAAVIAALRRVLPETLAAQTSFAEPRQIRAAALRIFDRSFAVTYALEAIAIIVGLTGVAATVSARTLARTKEFGMLRHIGVLRGQIVLMLGAEGALLGALGAAAGLGLGLGLAQVLIHVVNPQSFHWTMDTRLPLGLFAGLALALVLASAGTAMIAGRGALSAGTVRAVREDW